MMMFTFSEHLNPLQTDWCMNLILLPVTSIEMSHMRDQAIFLENKIMPGPEFIYSSSPKDTTSSMT
jgi:hypothetical protein